MGTPMAVNFANLFMSKLESDMLNEFNNNHGTRPQLWLRFIDDIFFVWVGDKDGVENFIKFCNSYSNSKGMKSNITFKARYSSHQVEFLDMITDLFCKPTAKHQYLHRSSFHPPNVLRSLPKT